MEKVSAAYTSNPKITSRRKIRNAINKLLGKNKSISFLEFWGSGEGARFYADNLNINYMVCLENDKDQSDLVTDEVMREINADEAELYDVDILRFINDHCPEKQFDVINLDFCSTISKSKNNSYVKRIRRVFRKNAIKDDGLIFFTFAAKHWLQVRYPNVMKNSLKTSREMYFLIKEIAVSEGYEVKLIHRNRYSSTNLSTMVNIGISVKKIV